MIWHDMIMSFKLPIMVSSYHCKISLIRRNKSINENNKEKSYWKSHGKDSYNLCKLPNNLYMIS